MRLYALRGRLTAYNPSTQAATMELAMQGEERVADGPFERELLRKAFTLCGGTCEDNERVRACVCVFLCACDVPLCVRACACLRRWWKKALAKTTTSVRGWHSVCRRRWRCELVGWYWWSVCAPVNPKAYCLFFVVVSLPEADSVG